VLLRSTREGDTVGRIGGDEFVVACAHEGLDMTAVADRIGELLSQPYRVGGQTITIGASVGAALVERGATAEGLMAAADVAMYSEKADHRLRATG
jgi:diguanylate cyclase (GGDEF)-like protein